jgi:hypothetical protein
LFAFNRALVYWGNHWSETDFVFYEMCSTHEWISQILAVSTMSNKNIWIQIDFLSHTNNNNLLNETEHWTTNIEYCSITCDILEPWDRMKENTMVCKIWQTSFSNSWDLFKLKFSHHFTELFSKNPRMRTEISCTTSLDEHLREGPWGHQKTEALVKFLFFDLTYPS